MKRNLIPMLGGAMAIAGILIANPIDAQTSGKRPTPRPSREHNPSVSPRPFDEPSARIHIGERAPDFELDGSNGKPVRLASLRGDWVALVFGDRCAPFSSLISADRELRLIGVRLVAVCREKAGVVTAAARRDQIPSLVLADATGQVSTLYGLRSGVEPSTRPGLLILDRRGVVQNTLIGQDLPASEIVRIAKETMDRPQAAQRPPATPPSP